MIKETYICDICKNEAVHQHTFLPGKVMACKDCADSHSKYKTIFNTKFLEEMYLDKVKRCVRCDKDMSTNNHDMFYESYHIPGLCWTCEIAYTENWKFFYAQCLSGEEPDNDWPVCNPITKEHYFIDVATVSEAPILDSLELETFNYEMGMMSLYTHPFGNRNKFLQGPNPNVIVPMKRILEDDEFESRLKKVTDIRLNLKESHADSSIDNQEK